MDNIKTIICSDAYQLHVKQTIAWLASLAAAVDSGRMVELYHKPTSRVIAIRPAVLTLVDFGQDTSSVGWMDLRVAAHSAEPVFQTDLYARPLLPKLDSFFGYATPGMVLFVCFYHPSPNIWRLYNKQVANQMLSEYVILEQIEPTFYVGAKEILMKDTIHKFVELIHEYIHNEHNQLSKRMLVCWLAEVACAGASNTNTMVFDGRRSVALAQIEVIVTSDDDESRELFGFDNPSIFSVQRLIPVLLANPDATLSVTVGRFGTYWSRSDPYYIDILRLWKMSPATKSVLGDMPE